MEPQLLAKSFKYTGHPGCKGALFTGAVYIDDEGIYVLHNRFTWESGNTAWATFGALGALINYLCTRKKTVDYPFSSSPFADLPEEVQARFTAVTPSRTATLAIIPKESVTGYLKSFMKGARILVGDVTLWAMGAKKDVWERLSEMGYMERAEQDAAAEA